MSTHNHHIKITTAMTPFPYTIETTESLLDAKQKMAEHDIRHLPVSKSGQIIGIISDRDIRWALDSSFELGEESEILVERIYRKDFYLVDIELPLVEVLRHMHENRIGSALVKKNDKLVGIFTTMDACRVFADHLTENSPEPAVA